MIALVRVDNRLIHGQVVEAWLPQLHVDRVVVADDEAASSVLVRSAMALAVQGSVEVDIEPLHSVDFNRIANDTVRTLVLVREVEGAMAVKATGLKIPRINLGNVHYATGRKSVTPSVYLSESELSALKSAAQSGVVVEARAVPNERPVFLDEIQERFNRAQA